MTQRLDHVTQKFLAEHPTHKFLWETLQSVVPHWNGRLKRRWIKEFLPYWRTDLIGEVRQSRYLQLALRRGWFDEAAGARRWVTFIDLLDDYGTAVSPAGLVNLFNVLAALPVVPEGVQLHPSQRDIIFDDEVLDATRLTACVTALMVEDAQDGSVQRDATSSLYHVRRGRSQTAHGAQWLAINWGAYKLRPVALIEPFGLDPWSMVSELGVDQSGELVAYHRMENTMAELGVQAGGHLGFNGETRRHEPVGLMQPDVRTLGVPELKQVFRCRDGIYAGLTSRGAVAIFATKETS